MGGYKIEMRCGWQVINIIVLPNAVLELDDYILDKHSNGEISLHSHLILKLNEYLTILLLLITQFLWHQTEVKYVHLSINCKLSCTLAIIVLLTITHLHVYLYVWFYVMRVEIQNEFLLWRKLEEEILGIFGFYCLVVRQSWLELHCCLFRWSYYCEVNPLTSECFLLTYFDKKDRLLYFLRLKFNEAIVCPISTLLVFPIWLLLVHYE